MFFFRTGGTANKTEKTIRDKADNSIGNKNFIVWRNEHENKLQIFKEFFFDILIHLLRLNMYNH